MLENQSRRNEHSENKQQTASHTCASVTSKRASYLGISGATQQNMPPRRCLDDNCLICCFGIQNAILCVWVPFSPVSERDEHTNDPICFGEVDSGLHKWIDCRSATKRTLFGSDGFGRFGSVDTGPQLDNERLLFEKGGGVG